MYNLYYHIITSQYTQHIDLHNFLWSITPHFSIIYFIVKVCVLKWRYFHINHTYCTVRLTLNTHWISLDLKYGNTHFHVNFNLKMLIIKMQEENHKIKAFDFFFSFLKTNHKLLPQDKYILHMLFQLCSLCSAELYSLCAVIIHYYYHTQWTGKILYI